MSSCSIKYICAKLFIVSSKSAIVLFPVHVVQRANSHLSNDWPQVVCIDEWDLLLNRIVSN